MNELLMTIKEIKDTGNKEKRNELIKEYIPFILGCVSKTTKRYVRTENDEEYLIGLTAFDEAIDRFDEERGAFLSYAGLLISSRVMDYLRKEKRHYDKTEYDEIIVLNQIERIDEDLVLEIEEFKRSLSKFSIELESLVESAPKHEATRINTTRLGKQICNEEELVSKLYRSKRLPIPDIILRFKASKKTLRTFKNFIIAIIIVVHEKLDRIESYLVTRGE